MLKAVLHFHRVLQIVEVLPIPADAHLRPIVVVHPAHHLAVLILPAHREVPPPDPLPQGHLPRDVAESINIH